MDLKLIYFNFPFWRAEVSRISLFLGDIDFVDLRISSDEFQRIKVKGKLDNGTIIPFHQLPCLIVNNKPIAQTAGIARFCGKLSNLYPTNDSFQSSVIDQYIDIATDITTMIVSTKVNNRDELFLKDVTRKLFILDKAIDDYNSFLVGNKMTIADIAIWSLMCWLSGGNIKGIPKEILKDLKNIIRVCLVVDKNQKINKWIKKSFPEGYKRNFTL